MKEREDMSDQDVRKYNRGLLRVIEEKIDVYQKSAFASYSGPSVYSGRDRELCRQEISALLKNKHTQLEIASYEAVQEGIRKQLVKMDEIGAGIPLAYLFRVFHADDFLRHCVLLSLAPELENRFGRIYSLLPDNCGRDRPTFQLCVSSYSLDSEKRRQALEKIYQDDRVWEYFFDNLPQSAKNRFMQEMKLEKRVLDFIFSIDTEDETLLSFCCLFFPQDISDQPMLIHEEQVNRLLSWAGSETAATVFYLYGSYGSGRKHMVRHFFKEICRPCLFIDANGLLEDNQNKVIKRVLRESVIRQSGICIWNFQSFLKREKEYRAFEVIQSMMEQQTCLFILSDEKWPYEKGRLPNRMLELKIEDPTAQERIVLWSGMLQQENMAYRFGLEELAYRFSLTPGQIRQCIKRAKDLALWNEQEEAGEEFIYEVCQSQAAHHLSDWAFQVNAVYGFEDLVLRERPYRQLQEACGQIRHYHQVYGKWGFGRTISYGRGVSMLFYGPPGTGKTMGAQVIAKELHMDLYKVDLSAVMSKYIGETEKNLGGIFREIKKSQSILFFDEADALFGKRSEIKDAQDKYANAETAYLLQKMEEYEGIVILATNLLQNFDEAFKRRIKFIIEFTLPDRERRFQLWQKVFPAETPLGEDIDYEYLAERFELSGSSIKSAAVTAAFLAASGHNQIGMEHILSALCEEMKKSGKTLRKEELGEYYHLMAMI